MDHFLTILQTVDNDLTLYNNTVTALSDTTTAVQGIVDSKLPCQMFHSMASDGQAATNDIQSLNFSGLTKFPRGPVRPLANILQLKTKCWILWIKVLIACQT